MSLRGNGAVEIQNAKTSTDFFEEMYISRKGKPSRFDFKVYFFRMFSAFFADRFQKGLSVSVLTIYLDHLGGYIRQIMRQI